MSEPPQKLKGILGEEDGPEIANLLKKIRASGSPALVLDAGCGVGEYASTRDLLAALLRSLAARNLARAAGKGSFFSLTPGISPAAALREESVRLVSEAREAITPEIEGYLLPVLLHPKRVNFWKRCKILLEVSRALSPDSGFRDLIEGRFLYLRKRRDEAEKIFRRLAQSSEPTIHRLGSTDLVSILMESRRFEEAKKLSGRIHEGHPLMPMRFAISAILLGDLKKGVAGFTSLGEEIASHPGALREIRLFLAHHKGPFGYLLRQSRTLRDQLYQAAPEIFNHTLVSRLGRPLPISRAHLRRAIQMLEELQESGAPEEAMRRVASFLEADLAALVHLDPKKKTCKVAALGGDDRYVQAAQKRVTAFQKEAAKEGHPVQAAGHRPEHRFFLSPAEQKKLLSSPHSLCQCILPIRDRSQRKLALIVEASYIFVTIKEEVFFLEELARRLQATPAKKTASPRKKKTKALAGPSPGLDAFPDYAKTRFGYPLDLRVSGRALRQILPDVAVAAASRSPILLLGESGAGKEVLARYIHFESRQKEGPFVAFNCNAVPSELVESELFGHRKGAFTGAERDRTGLFDVAQEGTLLLDEIGDLKPEIQGKLLRVLQEGKFRPVGEAEEKKFSGRVIAATHRNLKEMLEKGDFREDLYYRLSRFIFSIPPLRERRDEILPLVQLMLRRFAEEEGREEVHLESEAEGFLWRQSWEGNVRSLENFVYKLALFYPGESIGAEEVEATARKFDLQVVEKINSREATRELVQMALDSVPIFDGKPNVSKAAQFLGWNRTTLHAKMGEFQLKG